jgi:hypothetical protein
MRNLVIACGIGILGAAAWTVAAGEGGSGHGSMHGSAGHQGIAGQVRHSSHAPQMGIFFPFESPYWSIDRLSGEPGPAPAHLHLPSGGVVVGGPEHPIVGHVLGPAIHPIAHVAARIETGDVANAPLTSADDAQTQQDEGATAQPNPPNASRLPTRPPGATGPGRPVIGWSGPGLPGPGRPASPGR